MQHKFWGYHGVKYEQKWSWGYLVVWRGRIMNDLCDFKKRILRYIWPHRIATVIFDIHKNLCMNMQWVPGFQFSIFSSEMPGDQGPMPCLHCCGWESLDNVRWHQAARGDAIPPLPVPNFYPRSLNCDQTWTKQTLKCRSVRSQNSKQI